MNRKTYWLMVLFEAGLGGLGLCGLALTSPTLVTLTRSPISACLWGVGAAIITYLVLVQAIRLNHALQQKLTPHIMQLNTLFKALKIWQLALVAALAGFGEELLFRAFLQSWLSLYLPAILALVLASLVFAALHWLSVTYFVATLIMGMAFGAVYQATQDLLLVAIWHGVYDFIALIVVARYPHRLMRVARP